MKESIKNFGQLLKKIDPKDTAFVVGNGINLYKESQISSWGSILKGICDEKRIGFDPTKQNALSFPEIANLINLSEGKKQLEVKQGGKSARYDVRWRISGYCNPPQIKEDIYQRFLNYMSTRNIPVITTNFDTFLTRDLNEHVAGKGEESLFKRSTTYYWNYCYNKDKPNNKSEDFKKLVDNFAIWHMHGSTKYPSSIIIGLTDYVNAITKAKSMISGRSDKTKSRYPLYAAKDDNWIGRNTWLHLFFHKNLVFLGLALDKDEVFLRWLLIQRAFYLQKIMKNNPKLNKQVWYVHADNEVSNDSSAKRMFFKACGMEMVSNNSFDDIYQCFK